MRAIAQIKNVSATTALPLAGIRAILIGWLSIRIQINLKKTKCGMARYLPHSLHVIFNL
jgi:hypothetical protein